MQVFMFFFKTMPDIFKQMDLHQSQLDEDVDEPYQGPQLSGHTRSIIMSVAICYLSRLEADREKYLNAVLPLLRSTGVARIDHVKHEISLCQSLFLHGLELGPTIAKVSFYWEKRELGQAVRKYGEIYEVQWNPPITYFKGP
jgi:hypothetical protein